MKKKENVKIGNHKLWRKSVNCEGKGCWHLQDKVTPCGQNFIIDENDIKKRGSSYYGVRCPNCGSFIEISASDIPERVKDKAMRIY